MKVEGYIYTHMHFLAALIKCAMHGTRDVCFKMFILYIRINNLNVNLINVGKLK